MEVERHLQAIRDEVGRAAERLADICVEMERLGQGGMCTVVVIGRRAARNGGVEGQRGVYGGGGSFAGVAAGRPAGERGRWGQLQRAARELDDWLYARECELGSLARRCRSWPGAERERGWDTD
jgi:hypothetical protein